MRWIRPEGKKHGVSLCRNRGGSPQARSTRSRNCEYFFSVQASLNQCRRLGIKKEHSAVHDLTPVDPDVELPADDINVRRGIPVSSRMRPIRISEGDVNARN